MQRGVQHLYKDFNFAVIVRLCKNFFHFAENIILICAYVPPEGSVVYGIDGGNGIDLLKQKILEINTLYPNDKICLMGDLNARTGQRNDYFDDGVTGMIGMEWYDTDDFEIARKSKDRVVNRFGVSLIEMCMELGIHIVNGRMPQDIAGEFTFINKNGCSVIDYVLLSSSLFKNIKSFTVLPNDVSCHFPLKMEMNLGKNGTTDVTQKKPKISHIIDVGGIL